MKQMLILLAVCSSCVSSDTLEGTKRDLKRSVVQQALHENDWNIQYGALTLCALDGWAFSREHNNQAFFSVVKKGIEALYLQMESQSCTDEEELLFMYLVYIVRTKYRSHPLLDGLIAKIEERNSGTKMDATMLFQHIDSYFNRAAFTGNLSQLHWKDIVSGEARITKSIIIALDTEESERTRKGIPSYFWPIVSEIFDANKQKWMDSEQQACSLIVLNSVFNFF